MTTFSFDHKALLRRGFLLQLLTCVIMVVVVLLFEWIAPGRLRANWLFLPFFFCVLLLRVFIRETVYHVAFDDGRAAIRIVSGSLWGRPVERFLVYADARVEVYSRHRNGARHIERIDLMKGKREVAALPVQKGGFDADALYAFWKAAEARSIASNIPA